MISVLLVDDDPQIHRVVANVLERAGHSMASARSGAECVQRVRDGFRGVILMDIQMPGLSGWDTIRALREQALMQGNVVCMLTGMPPPRDDLDPLSAEVLDYLNKPFRVDDLLTMVEGAMAMLAM